MHQVYIESKFWEENKLLVCWELYLKWVQQQERSLQTQIAQIACSSANTTILCIVRSDFCLIRKRCKQVFFNDHGVGVLTESLHRVGLMDPVQVGKAVFAKAIIVYVALK